VTGSPASESAPAAEPRPAGDGNSGSN
jgi:hypothetical protein